MIADEADRKPSTDEKGVATQRLDKWLWYARLIKSRTQAASVVAEGKVRINRVRASKPSQTVRVGDVVTVALRGHLHVLKVLAPGQRRGPPTEAHTLYRSLAPEPMSVENATLAAHARRERGAGRPEKRERRQMERFKGKR